MEIYFILTLLGLVIGSFISVVSYRLPKGLGFIKGRSFCDSCKSKLFWFDNIPVLSFLIYKGKSRCCGQKISIRYPLIELTTAICFVVLYYFSFSPAYYVLSTILLAVLVIDIEYQIIPDEMNWLILLFGVIFNLGNIHTILFFGLFTSSILLLIHILTFGKGMGLGDVKLAIGLGLWFNFLNALNWLFVSFLTGGLVASILLISRKANLKTKVAFGPFLIIGFWIILIGEKVNWLFLK